MHILLPAFLVLCERIPTLQVISPWLTFALDTLINAKPHFAATEHFVHVNFDLSEKTTLVLVRLLDHFGDE